ncbi:hypothetical protein [Nocardia miyunensis]|uniref:hypothetical protein n=1 Tax=Nocardia miyunensis TaxID=282684 RepID=UPI00082BED9F|nr:hypothetical protein [Nocardia miyunensis]
MPQEFADPAHIRYGSDGPFAPPRPSPATTNTWTGYDAWPEGGLRAINRGDAENLFPRSAA